MPFHDDELTLLHDPLRAALEPSALRARLGACVGLLPGDRAGAVLDRFHLTQYGHQKDGSDLAGIGTFVDWRAPLFDPAWVGTVHALPDRWKVGDRLHRHLIAGLRPELLAFPDERYGRRALDRRPPAVHWVRGRSGPPLRHYLDQGMFRDGPILDLFDEHRNTLPDLVDPRLFDRLRDDQRATGGRPHLAFSLLALAQYRRAV
jgi:hypothetical protein